MTTLTAPARSDALHFPGPSRRGFLLGFFGTLVVAFMLLAGTSIAVSFLSAGRIMPGVHVAGVPVGGLDRAAAHARLAAELPSATAGALRLSVDGQPVEIPFSELGRAYAVDDMLDAAFGVARSGDLVSDAISRVRVLAIRTTVPALITVQGEAAVDQAVAELANRFNAPSRDAVISQQDGRFVVENGQVGARLDAAELRVAMLAAMKSTAADPLPVSISTQPLQPALSTEAAAAAADAANLMIAEPIVLRGADEPIRIQPAELAALIAFETLDDGSYAPILDEERLRQLVRPLAPEVAQAPRNASFEWGANGIVGVVPAAEGRKLDVRATVTGILDALGERGSGAARRAVPLAIVASAPALSTRAAEAAAPKMRRLATWTTFYVPGESNYWGANISIPANDLDGYVLAPGEWFSFWNGIGPVTTARGYGYGGVIINGRSFPTGALAGGICSTSTTLFNAAMRAGLEIGERTNHSYYIERYPVGLDATVLKTDTSVTDMTFRNDTKHPIVIRSYTAVGSVRFDVWGVADGRTVQLSNPTTWNHRAAVDTTVVNRNLRPGQSVRVEYPHDGFASSVTRRVFDADGKLLHENVWVSYYNTVNGIVEVGPRR
jgi:vancomycin resistance protein YoaR